MSSRANPLTSKVAVAAILAVVGFFGIAGESRAADDSDPFYGIISQRTMHAEDFDKMEWGRLGSFRYPVDWGAIQPAQGADFNWDRIDSLVEATSRRGIDFLPTMYNSPNWLSTDYRRMPVWGPGAISLWKKFLTSAVARFGTDGTFWVNNPEVPYRPVMKWQIWNEPNIRNFAKPVSPRRYAKLMKVSAAAIRRTDPNAKLVTGGLYAKPPKGTGIESSKFFNRLYRTRGFKQSFNIAAIHPYASNTGDSIRRTFPLRWSLNRHHDRRKHMVITELGWGSDSATTFGKGDADGQGLQLRSAYRKYLKYRRKLKLDSIYWFSWSDLPPGADSCSFCHKTGLFDSSGEAKPAWFRLLDFTHEI